MVRRGATQRPTALTGPAPVPVLATRMLPRFRAASVVQNGCRGAQGRQWRISDAYLGTAAQAAFERVLQRGGVIGGSSAGAAFQGDVMIRGNKEPNDLSILLDPDHLEGFGYATGAQPSQAS